MRAAGPIHLAGPTAVGKSAVAMELARRLGGEIISVDSMQVYRGMDIGTAKASREERAEVPHHLIDVAGITEHFDAARFVRLAEAARGEIEGRGRVAIFCGGTGLYFSALLKGLGEAPASDATIRAELESTPLEALLEELKARDLATWERIDRRNPRRVVRALEVIRLTGKPFSGQRAKWGPTEPGARVVGLTMEREGLVRRINQRVDRMFRDGLMEETKGLAEAGLRENRTAAQALGYKQALECLEGRHSPAETVELVKVRTRQFAKRQGTWFQGQLACEWMEVKEEDGPEGTARRIVAALGRE